MTIKVLYTDIDGTLVGPLGNLLWDGDRKPTLVAAEALVRAATEGLEIVPLTGRTRIGMFEVARLLGLESWICELGGVRAYERGTEVIVEQGEFPGDGTPAEALWPAVDRLVAAFPGRIEEHSPWNAARESSLVLRGDVGGVGADGRTAAEVLAEAGFGWAELHDNGVLPRPFPGLPDVARVHAYHLVPRGVSKLGAIAADQAKRGLDPGETAMIGDAGADLECRVAVGRCFLVGNGLVKDPDLGWATEPGSGVEVTEAGFGSGFAEVVNVLLGGG